jgi:hypothetical protein
MILTESQIRKIVRESMLLERKSLATVSDVTRFKPQISDWVEVLLDEFSQFSSRWDEEEATEKRLEGMIDSITNAISSALIDVSSGMSYSAKKKISKASEKKQKEKWEREKLGGGSVLDYGAYGT